MIREAIRFIGSMLDVTDLKKSRRRIQECKMEAIDAIPD
jgi:hypothetical protein